MDALDGAVERCGCEVPGDIARGEKKSSRRSRWRMNWAGPALDLGFQKNTESGSPDYWDMATLADQYEIRIENFISFFYVTKKKRDSRGT